MDSPELALDMHSEAVTLYCRARTEGAKWRELQTVPLESEDLARELDELRVAALVHGGKDAKVALWLPPDQILVRRAQLTESTTLDRAFEARRILSGDTIYEDSELAVAVSPPDSDGWSTILATLVTTTEEARLYARRWGLVPGIVSTRSEADAFTAGSAVFEPRPTTARRAASSAAGFATGVGRRIAIGLGTAAIAGAAVWAAFTWIPTLVIEEPTALFTDAPHPPAAQILVLAPSFAPPDAPPASVHGAPDPITVPADRNAPAPVPAGQPLLVLTYYRPGTPTGRTSEGAQLSVGAAPGAPSPAETSLAALTLPEVPVAEMPAAPAMPLPEAGDTASSEEETALAALTDETIGEDAGDEIVPAETPGDELVEAEGASASEAAPGSAPLPLARPVAETETAAAEPEDEAPADIGDSAAQAPLEVPPPIPAPSRGPSLAVVEPDAVPGTVPTPALRPSAGSLAALPASTGGSTGGATVAAATPAAAPGSADALDGATRFAILIAPEPPARPADIASQTVVIAPDVSTDPAPDRGENRGAVRSGTRTVALDMNAASLIGIINADGGRRALVRLPGGEFKRLANGDRLDGWQVSMIGIDAMRLTQGGREITLPLISR